MLSTLPIRAISYFNSIKVQLRPKISLKLLCGISHFNSIKVQLRHSGFKVKRNVVKFQFHKGTIKTLIDAGLNPAFMEFQFHKGTIKTKSKNILTSIYNNFNSIKVQLRQLGTLCPN